MTSRDTGPSSRVDRCAYAVADQDALIDRLLEGDEDAADCWMRAYRSRVAAAVRRLLPRHADVEDVVQDTFFQAFRALSRFRRDAQLVTWLHRIAVNRALMQLRARGRRPEVPLDGALNPEALHWGGHSPEVSAIRAETASRVRDAIETLPGGYRTVIERVHLGETPTRDAAVELGITTNAVKIRAIRGRRALKARLAATGLATGQPQRRVSEIDMSESLAPKSCGSVATR